MTDWLPAILRRIQDLAARGRVRFTLKALDELEELRVELAEEDVYLVLANLGLEDFFERLRSTQTAEWLYVFKPVIDDLVIYVKVLLRSDCILISFHEDESHDDW